MDPMSVLGKTNRMGPIHPMDIIMDIWDLMELVLNPMDSDPREALDQQPTPVLEDQMDPPREDLEPPAPTTLALALHRTR